MTATATSIVTALALLLGSGTAGAQRATASSPAAPAAPAPGEHRMWIDAQGGLDAPLGNVGLAVSYAPGGGRFSVGGGLGAVVKDPNAVTMHYALFGRARLVRLGAIDLEGVVTASIGDRFTTRQYQRPQFAPDNLQWKWGPALRADAGLAAAVKVGAWGARLEGGVGYMLNQPSCTYSSTITYFVGSCNDPMIPSYYHFDQQPGRVAPYLSLAFVRALDGGDDRRAVRNAAAREDRTAPRASANAADSDSGSPGPAFVAFYDGSGDDNSGDGAGVPGREARRATAEQAAALEGPADDAHADNAFVAPTALTQPAGSLVVTLRELALVDATYGVTDRIQASAGVGYVIPGQRVALATARVKVRIADAGRFHVAALTGAFGGIDGKNHDYALVAGAGPIASACLDERCDSILSTSVLVGAARVAIQQDGPAQPRTRPGVVASPSAVIALAAHFKLVGEAHFLPGVGIDPLWLAGMRIPYGPFAIDVGAFDAKYPYGNVSWRW